MSDAATTATVTETTADTSGADSSTDDGVFDALGAAIDSIVAPESNETTSEGSTETKEPEKKPEPEKKTAPAVDPFSDEALKTPEGIKTARTKLLEERAEHDVRRRKLDKFDIKLQNKGRELAEQQQALANDRATARWLHAQIGLLKTGTTAQLLETLGNLTGRSGRKVWEDLTQAALRDGKEPPEHPKLAELEQKNRELQERLDGIEQKGGEEKAEQRKAFVAKRKREIGEAAGNAETYPELSKYRAAGKEREIVNYVVQLKAAAVEEGKNLTDAQALAIIESEIVAIKGGSSGQAAVANPQSTGKAPAQKPGGQSSQSAQTTSIAPSVARTNPTVRVLTEDERIEELKRDADYIANLFR
jgi:hypothetical protein